MSYLPPSPFLKPILVSTDDFLGSLPSGESEPSVMLAWASAEPAVTEPCQGPVAAEPIQSSDGKDVPAPMQGSNDCGLARDDVKPGDTMQESRPAHLPTGTSDPQALIDEIFIGAARLLPRELPPDFQERLLAAIESDAVFADPPPLFLQGPIEPPCSHPWATQDEIGRPYCQACGEPWNILQRTRDI
jgi:hypothetical protein